MYQFLVVDDSVIVRSVIIKTIRLCLPQGCTIEEAENGADALNKLKNFWADMIFTDINMPVMDGLQFVEELRKNGVLQALPVVVISTEGNQQRIESLKQAGVRAFLRKPFMPEQLSEIITSNLGAKNVDMHE